MQSRLALFGGSCWDHTPGIITPPHCMPRDSTNQDWPPHGAGHEIAWDLVPVPSCPYMQEDTPLGIEDLTAWHSLLGAKMRSAVRDHRKQLYMHVRGMGA